MCSMELDLYGFFNKSFYKKFLIVNRILEVTEGVTIIINMLHILSVKTIIHS